MVIKSSGKSRGQVLSEAFFFRKDLELSDLLRRSSSREEAIKSLETVMGIRDPKVCECLVDAGFDLATARAFIWAPVIFVAWADGRLDHFEKHRILQALPRQGVSMEATRRLIDHIWFANPPSERVCQLWTEFIAALLDGFKHEDFDAVANDILALCEEVANTSGGFLGFGKVSQQESQVIERIKNLLQCKEEIKHGSTHLWPPISDLS
jgi:hypothetical protein